jgi:hypothetical protein
MERGGGKILPASPINFCILAIADTNAKFFAAAQSYVSLPLPFIAAASSIGTLPVFNTCTIKLYKLTKSVNYP